MSTYPSESRINKKAVVTNVSDNMPIIKRARLESPQSQFKKTVITRNRIESQVNILDNKQQMEATHSQGFYNCSIQQSTFIQKLKRSI